jgi:hypothetical protein
MRTDGIEALRWVDSLLELFGGALAWDHLVYRCADVRLYFILGPAFSLGDLFHMRGQLRDLEVKRIMWQLMSVVRCGNSRDIKKESSDKYTL